MENNLKKTVGRKNDWILKRPIAHRGLHDHRIPENSMAAFEAAIATGCAIEVDVQVTKDKVAVVFHDDVMKRLTGLKKRVTRVMFDDLRKLRIAETDYRIPTFKEFLEFVGGRVPILIEIKKNRGSKGIERIVIDMLKTYNGVFAIQSFNPIAIRNVRKLNPEIYCGLLSSKLSEMRMFFLNKQAVKNARLFFIAKPDFVSFEINSFPNRRVKKFREEMKLPIIGWTIKTKEDIESALTYCDGIIFENIENLKTHLKMIGGFFAAETWLFAGAETKGVSDSLGHGALPQNAE
jgi:glycerophosphoryl diester phosphodiesterase